MDFSSRLLLLPLFQGFSRLDFLDIVGRTPFTFRSCADRSVIFTQGEETRALAMLLGGGVECERESPGGVYQLSERVKAPFTLPLETLYGLHNRHGHTVRAAGEARVVSLEKQWVTDLMRRYPVFQINFNNQLCTEAQHRLSLLRSGWPRDLEGRFRHFLLCRCLRPVGEKTLRIRMEDLAGELGATRLKVSAMLSALSARGVLESGRGKIRIPALERL